MTAFRSSLGLLLCLCLVFHFKLSYSFITMADNEAPALFRVRTVTIFVNLCSSMFPAKSTAPSEELVKLMKESCQALQQVETEIVRGGFEVQTLRIATNPFGEWLYDNAKTMEATAALRLDLLKQILEEHDIQFCSLGPAVTVEEINKLCPMIVRAAPCFSCSANIVNVKSATAAAQCILELSNTTSGGLGNFRFCAASSCQPFIPFFPAAKSSSQNDGDGIVGFAVGLENGALAKSILTETKTIDNISPIFCNGMASALLPVQTICESISSCRYLGCDSSLNPSLDEGGSVAEAIECLHEVQENFGGRGTLAAAAAITTALQSLPGVKRVGYCGLMLPVCEDTRLAELASKDKLRISDLLSISSVCGVGIDTVPIPGDCEESLLASLILDVAGVANRWNKSLSCRVFPVPDLKEGQRTAFDSPYLCNCNVLPL